MKKMVALKYMLGKEIESDLFRCWFCDKQYNVKNGVAALRRHHEAKHSLELQQILSQLKAVNTTVKLESSGDRFEMDMSGMPGMPGGSENAQAAFDAAANKHHEMLIANIKQEEEMEMNYPGYHHPQNDAPSENQHPPNSMNDDAKPIGWTPSLKGRSIVWDHITWVPETQRASCNYCSAEFQIKGGTSALLRHLKTIHPAAINFDPENPPPIVRRKKRKAEGDYTMVSADTQSYMDNLLQQFMPEEQQHRGADGTEPSTSPPLALQDPSLQDPNLQDPNSEVFPSQPPSQSSEISPTTTTTTQNRAETEIDEVIRNLQKESATAQQPHQDLRTLLGMIDESEIISVSSGTTAAATTESATPIRMANDEEKQVSSSSSSGGSSGSGGSGGKKRKMEEASRQMTAYHPHQHHQHPGMNSGKLPLSMLHPLRRPPPIHSGLPSSGMPPPGFLNHRMPPMLMPHSSIPLPPPIPTSSRSPIKNNTPEAMEALDMEAKVLHNLSLRAVIDRENAMSAYYRTKSRKMELEIKKLEKELGEEQEPEPEPEQEESPSN